MTTYQEIFTELITNGEAEVTLLYSTHLPRLRAGLSSARKHYEVVAQFTGDNILEGKQFKYSVDPDNPGVVKITIVPIEVTTFTLIKKNQTGQQVG
jgi:hypothetical protein